MSTKQKTGTKAANTNLSTYFLSFNCGRKLIDVDFFAAHLLSGHPTSQAQPDVVVLSLQEIAPIAYSFLGSSLLSQYFHRFEIAVKQAFEDKYGAEAADNVVLMATENVGMTAIMVFTQQELLSRVRGVERGGTGVGLWEMGNKGAVGVRLWLEQTGVDEDLTSLSFVAAHLAPMESAWKRRNEDWRSICQRLVFTSDENSIHSRMSSESTREPLLSHSSSSENPEMLNASSRLFFGGDLNYRTSDIKPHPDDHKAWPSPNHQSYNPELFVALYKQDQLNRERKAGHTLHLMHEEAIDFPPTYKYSGLAQEAAYSLAKISDTTDQDAPAFWASHRFPAWCDRILYQSGSDTTVHAYTALPVQPTSDHRPVVLSASVPSAPVATSQTKPPFKIDRNWKSRRAQARRLEFLVGLAAYLTLTYEGNAIFIGTLIGIAGGVLALRSLLLT